MTLGRAMDLTGEKYNRLSVTGYYGRRGSENRVHWNCICDCGNHTVVSSKELRSGGTQSCGCLNKEMVSEFNTRTKTTHGMSGTRIYNIWNKMLERCQLESCEKYQSYGAKGIKVCKEWEDFSRFYEWSRLNGYEEHLTIDRIDNDGNYEPLNCRWADWFTQARNRGNTIMYTREGITKPLIEYAEDLGLKPDTVYARYKDGLKGEELLYQGDRRLL